MYSKLIFIDGITDITFRKKSAGEKLPMEYILPPAVLALCFLLLLSGVIICQRRRFQRMIKRRGRPKASANVDEAGQTSQYNETLRSVQSTELHKIPTKFRNLTGFIEPPVSMNVMMATPDDSNSTDYEPVESILTEVNMIESTQGISATLAYTSIPLHTKDDDDSSIYTTLNDKKEPPSFYQPLQPQAKNEGQS